MKIHDQLMRQIEEFKQMSDPKLDWSSDETDRKSTVSTARRKRKRTLSVRRFKVNSDGTRTLVSSRRQSSSMVPEQSDIAVSSSLNNDAESKRPSKKRLIISPIKASFLTKLEDI